MSAPRRKVIWTPRKELYLRGDRKMAIANLETWEIEIDYDFHSSDRQILLTEVHELGHLCFPDFPEKKIIRKFEDLVGSELWRLGYKKR